MLKKCYLENTTKQKQGVEMINSFLELKNAIELNNQNGGAIIALEPYSTITMPEKLHITAPITIEGNNATIIPTTGFAFEVNSSNVHFNRVFFDQIKTAIAIDGRANEISNISIEHCKFSNLNYYAINVTSTKSNSRISDVRIRFNSFVGAPTHDRETLVGFTACVNMCACSARTSENVDNCITENILIEGNRSIKGHRVTVNMVTSSCDYGGDVTKAGFRKNPILRNIRLTNNDFCGAWDAVVNVIGSFMRQEGGEFSNLEIDHNTIEYGVWGFGGTAVEPLFGELVGGSIKDIKIHHNTMTAVDIAGENQHAIAFCAGRTDYFHGTRCFDGGFSNLVIEDNIINATDRGILIAATDGLLDGKENHIERCYVKDVTIRRNKLYGVIDAFTFVAGYVEGRLFDYNIGVPPHNQEFSKLYEDNSIRATKCFDNYVDNIICEDNLIDGNRYKFKIYGTLAHGHSLLKDNRVTNVCARNNTFLNTEGHIHVTPCQMDGWCEDLGGNYVDLALKDIL